MSKKILYGIISIIIIVGIVMGVTKGFNFGLAYGANEKIEIYIGKSINKDEIKDITNQVFGKENVRIQTIEIFEDMAAITVKTASDEQLDKLVQLINEKYGLEYSVSDINVIKSPSIAIMDIVKPYIIPSIIAIVLIVVYMAVRYWKLTFWKVALWTVVTAVASEAVLASIYLIARIPVNAVAMPVALLVLGITVTATALHFDKKLEEVKKEDVITE